MSDYDLYTESDGEVLPEVLEHFPAYSVSENVQGPRGNVFSCIVILLFGSFLLLIFRELIFGEPGAAFSGLVNLSFYALMIWRLKRWVARRHGREAGRHEK